MKHYGLVIHGLDYDSYLWISLNRLDSVRAQSIHLPRGCATYSTKRLGTTVQFKPQSVLNPSISHKVVQHTVPRDWDTTL
jgi:hypothetical protein